MPKILSLTALLLILSCAVGVRAQRPTTVEGFADINGARIFYTITGRGEPLVLIHGYPLSGDLFDRQREALSGFYQVVTLDLRGFGRSVAPNEQASIELYASDVLGLMDFLGIQRAVIGGHSMGGITKLEMYRRAPERFIGMILNDTTAAPHRRAVHVAGLCPTVERAGRGISAPVAAARVSDWRDAPGQAGISHRSGKHHPAGVA
ncbi:MAG: alpha/beta fold hydrolase [Pyrinomonadaceae bacterium]